MSSDGPRLSTARRLGIAGLCLIVLVGSCLLAWWQWTRFESAGGSIQNFGYMLQWPLFGLFPAFMVWRIHKLANQPPAGAQTTEPDTGPASETKPRRKLGYVPPSVSAQDVRDPTRAEYNRYLAELHEDTERQSTTPEHAEGRS